MVGLRSHGWLFSLDKEPTSVSLLTGWEVVELVSLFFAINFW